MNRRNRRLSAWLVLACVGAMPASTLAQNTPEEPPPPRESSEHPARQPEQAGERDGRTPPPPSRPDGRRGGGGGGGGGRGGPDGQPHAGGGEPRPDEQAFPGRRQSEGPERGPRSMRMLDLRDLGSVLPPPPRGAGGPRERQQDWLRSPGGGGGRGGNDPFVVAPTPDQAAAGQDRVMDLVQRLSGPLDIGVSSIGEGIVLVMGSDEAQDRLEKMLGQVRELYAEKFEVEIIVVSLPAGQAPALGAVMSGGGRTIARCRQAVPRRAVTGIASIEEIHFIEGWQPVVADNSVGYQSIHGVATRGLRCEVIVGAGEEVKAGRNPGGVPIVVRGTVSDASIAEKVVDVTIPSGKAALTFGLPKVQERTISATGIVSGETTVVSILTGFEAEQVLVVGASAKYSGSAKN